MFSFDMRSSNVLKFGRFLQLHMFAPTHSLLICFSYGRIQLFLCHHHSNLTLHLCIHKSYAPPHFQYKILYPHVPPPSHPQTNKYHKIQSAFPFAERHFDVAIVEPLAVSVLDWFVSSRFQKTRRVSNFSTLHDSMQAKIEIPMFSAIKTNPQTMSLLLSTLYLPKSCFKKY